MLRWKKIKETPVFKNKWLKVDQVFFRLPNNRVHDYYFVRGNPVVAILGVTANKNVILVRQYRPSVGKFMVDIPGGEVEDGEDSKQAAKREFLEETGYELKRLKKLTSFYFDSGKSDKCSTIYVGLATNKMPPVNCKNEYLKTFEVSYNKLVYDIRQGKITEPTIRLAIFSLQSSPFKNKYFLSFPLQHPCNESYPQL